MKLKLVELATEADFAEVARLEHDAFETPMCKLKQLFFPIRSGGREQAIQETVSRQWAWHLADPTSRWLKVLDEESGKAVGAGQWHIYETDTPYAHGEDEECYWFPEGEERDAANLLMEQFMTDRAKWMSKPHMMLEICFTHPDYRQQGVGRMIMEWGTKVADSKGIEAYIDATDIGIPLYTRYGFHTGPRLNYTLDRMPKTPTRTALEEELLPFEWWPMWRPSNKEPDAPKPWNS